MPQSAENVQNAMVFLLNDTVKTDHLLDAQTTLNADLQIKVNKLFLTYYL